MIPPHLRRIRAYRFVISPLVLAGTYLLWIIWVARGGDPLLDPRIHNTILIGLAAWAVIAWPRDRRMLALLAHEVEALRRRIDEAATQTAPATKSIKDNLYAAKLIQGQLDQLNGRLDALSADFHRQIDAAVSSAFRRGMISGVEDEETGDVRALRVVPSQNGASGRS